jgi:hypothetical protein
MMGKNPDLFSGLITVWPRARVLWFWVQGATPRNLIMGPMSWISSGPVSLCSADALQRTGVSHDGPIPTLQFADIRWDKSTESLIQFDRIEAELGHPFEQDGAKRQRAEKAGTAKQNCRRLASIAELTRYPAADGGKNARAEKSHKPTTLARRHFDSG